MSKERSDKVVKTLPQLKPKDTFEVINYSQFNGEDTRVLNLLYQPIIGGSAVVLYQNLQVNANDFYQPTSHFLLQDMMSIGLSEFLLLRARLEAIGLLTTYVRKKDEGYHYIYILQNLLRPQEFLSDDVLSLLLLDRVGEERFCYLGNLFKPREIDLTEYSNITSNYTDTFDLGPQRVLQQNELVMNTNEVMRSFPTGETPILEEESFDWEFFVDSLSGFKVDKEFLTNDLKRIILTFHSLYGINELDMVEHVKHSLDYVTNQLDVKEFKHRVYKKYHQVTKQTDKAKTTQTSLTMEDNMERHKNELKHQGYSQEEIDVILSCKKIAPLIFLKAVKEQKNGFVSQNERWTIENLKNQSPLADEVINMLIHYCLVVLDNPSLNQNMVNTIANNWAQKGISKASEALNQVKTFTEEKAKKPSPRNNHFSKKPIRKESLPDWAAETNKRKETPLSKDEQSLIEEQLKQFTQGGEMP